MSRYAGSALVGIGAFVLAVVTLFVMIVATFGPIEYSTAEQAGYTLRRPLAWLAFVLVAGPPSVVLVGVPFAAARRWGTSALVALVVAMALGGLAADTALIYISQLNDCVLEHSFPYVVAGCD